MRITLIIFAALLLLGCGHTTPSGPVESTSPPKSESVDIPTAEATTTANDEVLDGGSDGEVEDGGTVKNVDRDKVRAYFNALENVQSVEEERKLLTEFAEWLKRPRERLKNGYEIEIVEKNGKHVLSCPYFPPVTPWTNHSFYDVKNLELLPRQTRTGEVDDVKAELESVRARDKEIFAQISKVKTGMTKEEVLGLLGEPNRREVEDNEWYYAIMDPFSQWIDETVQIKGYEIIFEDGLVKKRNPDGAHYYFEPRD